MTEPIKRVRRNVRFSDAHLKVCVDDVERRGMSGTHTFVERADSVTIMPVSELGRTVVLQQYRYPTQSYSWEVPMGEIEDHESPQVAARRELWEETGLKTRSLQQIATYFAAPGLTSQRVSVFTAKVDDCRLQRAELWTPLEDDVSACQVISLSELFSRVWEGKISDGFTLAALLLAQPLLDCS